jgi:hypothetical protein
MSGTEAAPGADRVDRSIDEAKAAADRAARETADTLDAMKTAAANAAQRGAAAVAEASSTASATADKSHDEMEDALEDAGTWLKARYRKNPVLVTVLAAAAGLAVLVWVGSIVRGIGRR